jgi:hypothetical protein
MLRWFKVSMHQSGQWIAAFTRESGVMIEETGSRRQKTWHRPAEFTPGWTQGTAVVVPWVEWQGEFGGPPVDVTPDTSFMRGPDPGSKLQFSVLFAGPDVPADEINSVCQPGDVFAGGLPLSNGETVWLQGRQVGISPDEQQGIDSAEREFRGFQVDGDISAISPPWALWIATSPVDDVPLLVNFPLGRRHVQARDPSGRARAGR